MMRSSQVILSPKPLDGSVPQINLADYTDKDITEDQKSLRNHLDLKENSLGYLDKPHEVLNTNPDNRKLQGLETMDYVKKNICGHFGYPYPLLVGNTKYDDASLHRAILYEDTLPPDAEAFFQLVNGIWNTNMSIDYTNKKTLSGYENGQANA